MCPLRFNTKAEIEMRRSTAVPLTALLTILLFCSTDLFIIFMTGLPNLHCLNYGSPVRSGSTDLNEFRKRRKEFFQLFI